MTDPELSIDDFPFRTDFKREEHVRLYAGLLDHIKGKCSEDAWYSLGAAERLPVDSGLRELRDLAKRLIHHCTESSDYAATVDFITKEAVLAIRGLGRVRAGRKMPASLLTTPELVTHEHMVPDAEILKLLTSRPENRRNANTEEILRQLVFRALVAGTMKKGGNRGQLAALNGPELKSSLPKKVFGRAVKYEEIPLQYWALMRYDEAKLLDELIPITQRAGGALSDYKRWKSLVLQHRFSDTHSSLLVGPAVHVPLSESWHNDDQALLSARA